MKHKSASKRILLFSSILITIMISFLGILLLSGIINMLYTRWLFDRTPIVSNISWSSDEEWIVFSCRTPLLDSDLYIMHSDGTKMQILTDDEHANTSPKWSPDGQQLLFLSEVTNAEYEWQDQDAEIYLIAMDNGKITNLTDNSNREKSPSWSPTGKQIAFLMSVAFEWDIYIIQANGKNLQQMTHVGDVYNFRWLPNGRIEYTTYSTGLNYLEIAGYQPESVRSEEHTTNTEVEDVSNLIAGRISCQPTSVDSWVPSRNFR
jgi:Tol biopolymer transport system component